MTQASSSTLDFIAPQSARKDIKKDYYDRYNEKDHKPEKTSVNKKEDYTESDDNQSDVNNDRFQKFINTVNTTIKNTMSLDTNTSKPTTSIFDKISNNFDHIVTDFKADDTPIVAIGDLLLAQDSPIISDLFTLDLNALANGETLTIAGGIDVSLEDNLLVFSYEGQTLETPSLTLDQFDLALKNIMPVSINLKDIFVKDAALQNPISTNQNIDIEEIVPPLAALKEIVLTLQDAIADKPLNSKLGDILKSFIPISNIKGSDIKFADTDTRPIIARTTTNQSFSNTSLSFGSGNSHAPLSLHDALAQKNTVSGQNLAISSKDTTPLIASVFVQAEPKTEASEESLTQFLNNNNLRVVRDGHLQSTQPLNTGQVNVILSKIANGSQFKRLSVRLDPPELGRVDIQLRTRTSDNTIKAHIIVERPEALGLLRKDIHQLEKMLAQSGLNIDENSISFDLSEGGDKDSQTQQAMKDLWRERNEEKLASNLQIKDQDSDIHLSAIDSEDYYVSDDAVNIKV